MTTQTVRCLAVDSSNAVRASEHQRALATAARRAARIAFETRAVAHKREVPAFLAGFAFVTLHPRLADEVGIATFGLSFDGADLGVRDCG